MKHASVMSSRGGALALSIALGLVLACGGGAPVAEAPAPDAPEPRGSTATAVAPEPAETVAATPSTPATPATPAAKHQALPFPLVEGATWTYEVVRHSADPGAVFFIVPVHEREPARVLETFTLTVGAPTETDGRQTWPVLRARTTHEGGSPETKTFHLYDKNGVVWYRDGSASGPVYTAEVPDHVLSMEKVQCRHALLSMSGTCTVGGGPLDLRPGMLRSVISAPGAGSGLLKVASFVLTAGIVRTGDTKPTITADLTAFSCTACPPVTQAYPFYDAWKRAKTTKVSSFQRLLAKTPPDAESIGAVLYDLEAERGAPLLEAALPLLPPEQRVPPARLVLATPGDQNRLKALADLPSLKGAPGVDEMLEEFFPPDLRTSAALLLEQEVPVLRATLKGGHFDSSRHKAMKKALDTHGTTLDEALVVLPAFSFEDAQIEAFELLLTRLSEEDGAALFASLAMEMSFDDSRIELLVAHPEMISKLSTQQKADILEETTFKKDAVEPLLNP